MELIRNLLKRGKVEPEEAGPLLPDVRAAMADVQAYARSHGGEIQLVGVSEEGDVRVRFRGTCRGCPMSSLTLKIGVEEHLRRLVPGVRRIIEER